MDIAAWLRELGLERYEQAFRDNDIDAEILPKLTAEDLSSIGVASVGHRRKLLEAIAALDAASAAEARDDAANGMPPQPRPDVAGTSEAERRQLTVLFCDLVGSTEFATRLDPEDMGALVHAYHAACRDVVTRWDGHIAKYMGDGVLAYFGYPHAHEDDAERAVRAGLELAAAIEALKTDADRALAGRIGIATGLVMVGELIGEGAAREHTVVGETPNLAARLQGLATPGTVVIAASTRRLAGEMFELHDLGLHRLKGFTEPVPAWSVAGESRAEGRFEALRGPRLTPLVGREPELALLLERWSWAREGEGQVVLLAGEPGIGKSRLVRALRERLSDELYTPISHFCSPYHSNSALYPVIGLLERAAGFVPEDTTDQRLEKLEALLARSTERLHEAIPLVAATLSIPIDKHYPSLNLSSQRQRQRTLEVLVEQLAGLAAHQPVVAIYEDVHWADPTTLDLLDLVVERVRRSPILVLITFRPDFSPPWAGQVHVTQLPLNRLGRRQGVGIVERLTGGKALPDEILEQIVAKTDGIPLFVEELTKTVLESGLLTEAGDQYELTGPLPPLAIPATLQDSLMARLDRLTPVKEIAQIGAVIGREFGHELLAAVAPEPEAQLNDALAQLITSELIFRRGVPPDTTYSFKHALVQETAYQSLLKSRRQQLHARIAEVLETRFPETAEQAPEVLARHFGEAKLAERAIRYFGRAGQLAMARSASKEATAHFREALALLTKLPETHERQLQESALQNGLGGALIHVSGIASQDVEESYLRARQLCKDVGDAKQLFLVEWGLCHVYIGRAEHLRARELADRLLELAKSERDTELLLQANHAAWSTLNALGEAAAAREAADCGWALYEGDVHSAHAFVYGGHDPGVCSRNLGAWAVWRLGYPDQALQMQEVGLALAKKLGHPQIVAHAYTWAACLHQFRLDRTKLREQAEIAVGLAREQAIANNEAEASMLLGWLMADQGEPEEGIRLIRRGLAVRQASGTMFHYSYFLGLLAEASASAGQTTEALELLSQALDWLEGSCERWFEPELHRLKGEFLLRLADQDANVAEASFCRAVEVAQGQDAKCWELRAATSLARLWREQGERHKAHDLLAPVYGWFTEGFDTADLKDAKVLLDELA